MENTPVTGTGTDTVTLSVLQPGKFVQDVAVPFGTTVRELSARLGVDGAENMSVMDDSGNVLGPDQPLTTNTSVSYIYKLAGASL